MRRLTLWLGAGLLATGLLAGGCSNDSRTPDEKFQAYLEQGNAAFKEKKYEDALKAYRKASGVQGVKQGVGAGYYGLSMAYEKLGRTEEAKQALDKAGELSPGLAAPHGAMGAMGGMGGMGGAGGADPHAGMGDMSGMAGLAALADSGSAADSAAQRRRGSAGQGGR